MDAQGATSSSTKRPSWAVALAGLLMSLPLLLALSRRRMQKNSSRDQTPPAAGTTGVRPASERGVLNQSRPVAVTIEGPPTPRWKKIAETTVAIGTLGLLLANVFQLFVFRQQTTLLLQQLEGTTAAVLQIDLFFKLDDEGHDFALTLRNKGHAIAKRVHSDLVITRRSLPDEDILQTFSPRWVVNFPDLGPDDHGGGLQYFPLNADDFVAIQNSQQTVRIEGRVTYNDGFTDQALEVCRSILLVNFVNNQGHPTGNSAEIFPCSEFQSRFRNRMQEKVSRRGKG